jgi:hypothetical protein
MYSAKRRKRDDALFLDDRAWSEKRPGWAGSDGWQAARVVAAIEQRLAVALASEAL